MHVVSYVLNLFLPDVLYIFLADAYW